MLSIIGSLLGFVIIVSFIGAIIQLMFEQPFFAIAVIGFIVFCCLYSYFYYKKHPEEKEMVKERAQLEKTLLLLVKATQIVEVNDNLKLQGKGKKLSDIHLIYKDKELCLLSDYKTSYPEQYLNLLRKVNLLMHYSSVEQPVSPSNTDQNIQFNDYIKRIDELNIDILDEDLSSLLDECYKKLKNLSDLLKKYPLENDKLGKLHDHYLPILMEILEQYCKIEKTKEDPKTKEKLISTLNLVIEAITNITSSLFEREHLDLNVNMDVLEDLLKKDGVVNDSLTTSMEDLYNKK